ncbi:sigma-70 family RNA polymerase sigma factor [Coprothermobacteraceae bacterium]|nr:sigma-70 family RNA polymerase sigma factor [Coprothermobacteraceae bacterium]
MEELIRRAKTGNVRAFEQLVELLTPRLLLYAMSLDPAEAEDLVQETWWKAYRNLDQFNEQYPLLPWLKGILRFEFLSRRRASKPVDLVEELIMESTSDEHLEEILDLVPKKDQDLMKMRFVDNLSYSEIAAKLNITEVNARKRVSNLLKLLRSLLS